MTFVAIDESIGLPQTLRQPRALYLLVLHTNVGVL